MKRPSIIKQKSLVVLQTQIQNKIYFIRGKRVMIDRDLAQLYGVETRTLNQSVKRNPHRFPDDFMFQFSSVEFENLISQNVISSWWGGQRMLPFAFTEQGVAMLSSVLNSKRAIQVNIQIMRIFTRLKQFLIAHKDMMQKIQGLEQKYKDHDKKITLIFQAIKELFDKEEKPAAVKEPIGFRVRRKN